MKRRRSNQEECHKRRKQQHTPNTVPVSVRTAQQHLLDGRVQQFHALRTAFVQQLSDILRQHAQQVAALEAELAQTRSTCAQVARQNASLTHTNRLLMHALMPKDQWSVADVHCVH